MAEAPETLAFQFTPVDAARPDVHNPHVQPTTAQGPAVDDLRAALGEAVLDEQTYAGETTVFVEKARIVDVLRHLFAAGFTYLADLGGIDRFTEDDRYEVFYNLCDLAGGKRLRVKLRVDEADLRVPTATDVYRAANWHEREAYDMFGLVFDGHPDLRRMYLPEDFEYFPLRKEFPLLGIPGSLPLPGNLPGDPVTLDPFPAAHGDPTLPSFDEPAVG